MRSLYNKNIILGVTGGIAAYKSAYLVRALKNHGANVRVVMTDAGQKFVTALTFQALSGNTVHTDLLDTEAENAMGHIALARWADAILVAPATANYIAKLVAGRTDDLLSAVCLATEAQLTLAPAMNSRMWKDKKTTRNIKQLTKDNILIFGPADGLQACDETGPGRMLEPDELLQKLAGIFKSDVLSGKRILITAGPTREAIDPVRFISNKSSGKMGYALADGATAMGAKVELISGPVALEVPAKVNLTQIETAEQMRNAVFAKIKNCDWLIAAAAVADYKPATEHKEKIKKTSDEIILKMQRNPDILAEVGKSDPKPFLIGFAAETENLEKNANAKLKNKNLDVIVANKVGAGLGFETDDNEVTIIWLKGKKVIKRMRKSLLARKILKICHQIETENGISTT